MASFASSRRLSRVQAGSALVLRATIAAAVAWLLAEHLAGHDDPFFAPLATVVALSAEAAAHGPRAPRLLLAMVVGIAAGEGSLDLVGHGAAAIGLAVLVAMALVLLADGAPAPIAQAAAAAVLVTATGGSAGLARIVDALIGAGVALVVELGFAPRRLEQLRLTERAALAEMSAGLERAALALRAGDARVAHRVVAELRAMRDGLADLAAARRPRFVRARLARESEQVGRLDLLADSVLVLVRCVPSTPPEQRAAMVLALRELARALEVMADAPQDRGARETAAIRALEAVRETEAGPLPLDAPLAAAPLVAVRLVARDVMAFAGVRPRPEAEPAGVAGAEPEAPAADAV
jgi:hypothetical protein